MRDHATAMDTSFMSATTFSTWLGGERNVPLRPSDMRVIDNFYDKYCASDSVEDAVAGEDNNKDSEEA